MALYIQLLSDTIYVLLCYEFGLRWVHKFLTKNLTLCATVSSVREFNQERYHEYGKITFANSSFTLGFIPLMAKAVLGVG